MKVDLKLLRDKLYLDIVDECTNSVIGLVNHGREICDNFQCEVERSYFCEHCGYSQYVHLCKKILKLNLFLEEK